ncbi:S8 family peptidase [Actinophytocola glycyrrhizae]|uniref:S8 family serine peptidase n=1 Tax=Actinophytocola glycyrrhizae TaxID=2044873 RepID=A0ABV9SAI7_9PSEU
MLGRRAGRRRTAVVLTGMAVAASTVVGLGPETEAQPRTPGAAPPDTHTVTLLTGDVVTMGGPERVRVQPAPGRERVSFKTRIEPDGDVHVLPVDVAADVLSGRLDARLFDVTGLVEAGYDDARRDDLPLIVGFKDGVGDKARSEVTGAETGADLPGIDATAVRADRSPTFWKNARGSVDRVWLDAPVRASLDESVRQIGAPAAWAGGHTGAGATVAVLDTGIDTTHPDLSDAVVAEQNFADERSEGPGDVHGHGTHVASIITGSGDSYRGVAPDAKLLNGKVLDDYGYGYESWIIAGMEWAATSGADVVNMSLGNVPTDGTDPLSAAVNRLTEETGTLFVAAAGNDGLDEWVSSPASADAALAVGAVDGADRLAEFSNRGPRVGDGAIKPEITAPGVDIVAARAAGSNLGEPVGDGYTSLSGTSMAAPHVAGAAAILAARYPDWDAERLKATLMSSARPNPDLALSEQGAGRVDVAAAVSSTVVSIPAALSYGIAEWPHHDDEAAVRTVTYANTGPDAVTLDLAAEVTGPEGAAAPAAMVTVAPAQVTVPAGGTAQVTVTVDTTVDTPDGRYTGAVTATGGERAVTTPLVVTREPESYDLTVRIIDHHGNPAQRYGAELVDVVNPRTYTPGGPPGGGTIRVPKGTYYLDTTVYSDTDDELRPLFADFQEPNVVIDRDTEFVFDARQTEQVDVRVADPDADEGAVYLKYERKVAWGSGTYAWQPRYFNHGYSTRPSTTSAGEDFALTVRAELAEPDGAGGYRNSPYRYNVQWTDTGRVPADLTRRYANRDLAKVLSTFAADTPGATGVRGMVETALPFTLTEYYTPDIPWFDWFAETQKDDTLFALLHSERVGKVYRKGTVTRERWNAGPYGPSFPYFPENPGEVAERIGDVVAAQPPMVGDQSSTRWASPTGERGSMRLLADGEVIAETSYYGSLIADLPPETREYTMRVDVDRSAYARLSTSVTAEWTFRSGHAENAEALPLLAVRFAPKLDDDNSAPAGESLRIPIYVQRNGVQDPGRVHDPVVEVSFDDGTSWRQVPVRSRHGQVSITVEHPGDAEFVSLRTSIDDPAGNAAKHTIIRAYALN